MAVRKIEGFNYTSGVANVTQKWTNTGGPPAISTSIKRTGDAALQLSTYGYVEQNFGGTEDTWIVGGACYFSSIPSAGQIFLLLDSSTIQVDLRLITGGELRVTLNGTALGVTSGLGLLTAVWYFIEFKATINNTTGAYTVKVNGTEVLAATSQDTQATSNAYATHVRIGNGGNFLYVDDVYICDNEGSVGNDFLGDVKVISLRPSGAGTYSEWTPSAGSNYQNVDETAPDDDTTYNSTSTAGLKDAYTYANVGESGAVYAININTRVRKDDAGARVIRPKIRIGGTDYNEDNVDVTDSYVTNTQLSTVSPATATAYTVSELDGAEFGIELVS